MIILPFVFTVVGSNDIAQLVKVSGYNVTVAVPGTFDEISLPISIWNEAVVKAGLGFRILLMIIFMDLTASFVSKAFTIKMYLFPGVPSSVHDHELVFRASLTISKSQDTV